MSIGLLIALEKVSAVPVFQGAFISAVEGIRRN